jgi:hypothetical protein
VEGAGEWITFPLTRKVKNNTGASLLLFIFPLQKGRWQTASGLFVTITSGFKYSTLR